MVLTVRPVRPTDAPAVARICLLTGNAGTSAEHLHTPAHQELPALVWALPYVYLPHTFGFVIVDGDLDTDAGCIDVVKGYILGTSDSNAFAQTEEETWWPSIRERFPLKQPEGENPRRTEADQKYVELVHRAPDPASQACLAFSPAHLHIDLLPEVQRQGWGRVLMGKAVELLRGIGLAALWLGLDLRNEAASKFYERLGFEEVEGAPANNRVLRFEKWKSA